MKLNRLKVSEETSKNLSSLKAKTGLTPNILCRIAFCLSLEDPTLPNPAHYPPTSEREIERPVLTGHWDRMFVALIKVRCEQDGLPTDDDTLGLYFRAHIGRGVMLLHKRVRRIHDLALLMPSEVRAELDLALPEASAEENEIDGGHDEA